MMPKREAIRSMQCDRRGFGTCGMIRQRLGWLHMVTLKECDECWKLGGPMSVSAARWREDYCRKVVGIVSSRDPKTVSIPALLTVMGKHMGRETAAAKLEQIAVRIGEKQATLLAAKYGGAELVERIAAMFDGLDPGQRAGEIKPLQRGIFGWYFEGVPIYKRPWISTKAAFRAFRDSWRGLRTTGCGCVKKAKDAVRVVAEKAKEIAG